MSNNRKILLLHLLVQFSVSFLPIYAMVQKVSQEPLSLKDHATATLLKNIKTAAHIHAIIRLSDDYLEYLRSYLLRRLSLAPERLRPEVEHLHPAGIYISMSSKDLRPLLNEAQKSLIRTRLGVELPKLVAISHDNLFALTYEHEVPCLWDLSESSKVTGFQLHNREQLHQIDALSFSPDSRTAVVATQLAVCRWPVTHIKQLGLIDLLLLACVAAENSLSKRIIQDEQLLAYFKLLIKNLERSHPVKAKSIASFLYRSNLEEKKCVVCNDLYELDVRPLRELSCCNGICKPCFDKAFHVDDPFYFKKPKVPPTCPRCGGSGSRKSNVLH